MIAFLDLLLGVNAIPRMVVLRVRSSNLLIMVAEPRTNSAKMETSRCTERASETIGGPSLSTDGACLLCDLPIVSGEPSRGDCDPVSRTGRIAATADAPSRSNIDVDILKEHLIMARPRRRMLLMFYEHKMECSCVWETAVV